MPKKQPSRKRPVPRQPVTSQDDQEGIASALQRISDRLDRLEQTSQGPPPTPGPSTSHQSDDASPAPPNRAANASTMPGNIDSDSDSDVEISHALERPTTSFGMMIGTTVSPKIKKKILLNKFVEMAELLPEYRFKRQDEFNMKLSNNNTTTLVRAKPKQDLTILQWIEAFSIYTSVYLDSANDLISLRNLTRSLLTYQKEILNMKRLNYDWVNYDRHFRLEREANPFDFATSRTDLLMHYQRPTSSSSGDNFRPSQKKSSKFFRSNEGTSLPFGYCFAFHSRDDTCKAGQSCNYNHKCPRCHRIHPAFRQCHNSPAPSTSNISNRGHALRADNKLPTHSNKP